MASFIGIERVRRLCREVAGAALPLRALRKRNEQHRP
jgi:hypothetical protein